MATIKSVIGYLHFGSNCAEAMTFYKEVFGGELFFMKAGDTPMAEQMPGMENLVMHASLTADGWTLYASDWCAPTSRNEGNHFSLFVECTDEASQNMLFARLQEGGKVHMELEDTFWGSRFGMVQDRFGIDWMLSLQKS